MQRWANGSLLTLLAGCFGGQTGDPGDNQLEVCHEELDAIPLADVADDVELRQAVEGVVGAERERSWALILVGPPSLWTERGLTPPADRAIAVTLTLSAIDHVNRVHSTPLREDFEFCQNYVEVPVQAVLAAPELDFTQTGHGTFSSGSDFQPEGVGLTFESLGACRLEFIDSAENMQLTCGHEVYANQVCTDPLRWRSPPTDSRSGMDVQALFEVYNNASSFVDNCTHGQPSRTIAEVRIPDSYCPSVQHPEGVPVTVRIEGATRETLHASSIHLEEDGQCVLDECDGTRACHLAIPEEEWPNAPRCSRVLVPVTLGDGHGLEALVQVSDDQTVLVGRGYRHWEDNECWAQQVSN